MKPDSELCITLEIILTSGSLSARETSEARRKRTFMLDMCCMDEDIYLSVWSRGVWTVAGEWKDTWREVEN